MDREKRIIFPALRGTMLLQFGFLLALLLLGATPALRTQAKNSQKVVDEAGLLSYLEVEELTEQFTGIAEEYACDVVVVTVESLDGENIRTYTDSYFYYNDYGYGDEQSGIILLIAMEERRYYFATRGEAVDIFTDYGLDIMDESVSEELSEGNYYRAFSRFGSLAEDFLKEASSGTAYDVDHAYKEPMPIGTRLLISVIAGLAVAVLVLVLLFSQLKSVRAKSEAWEYVRSGSFHVTRQRDIFLYRNVTRRRVQQDNGPGGRGGPGGGRGIGGSTFHSSPGGGRSGGRGGSF